MRSRFASRLRALLAVCALALGCDPALPIAPAEEVPEGCNPLSVRGACLLPFPSDHFLVDDATLPSGRRVELTPATFFELRGNTLDFFAARAADGWSPATPILAYFPVALDPEPLVRWDEDVGATERGEGPTVLVDAATGARVPHFAELDATAEDPTQRVLVIRPLVRLAPETRYVVGVRALVDVNGAAAPLPEGFRRLRDRADDAVGLARYETEIFPALEAAGFARSELQLAWDFTTGSEERLTGDMLAARQIAIDALAVAPAVRVVAVLEGDALPASLRPTIARQVELEIDAPRIVTSEIAGEAHLLRDATGALRSEGTITFPVTVLVPRSVAERAPGSAPARLLQYGHGFFGSRAEITNGYLDQFADDHGFVAIAADWWGMMVDDRNAVALGLAEGRAEAVLAFVERTHQGMLNFIVLAGAAGAIAELPELRDGDGAPYFDAGEVFFWGNSQGHILGGVYTAISPHVTRGVLGVGGANFSLIMFRSRAFLALRTLIQLHVDGPVAEQTFCALLQHWLDRIDPIHYARFVLAEPLEGAPPKQVLMHSGPGDEAVTSLAAELHARTLGIPLLLPSPFLPPLLDTAMAPAPSALVELDHGIEIVPTAEPPRSANPIHEAIRRNPRVQAQVDAFLRPGGLVTQTCDGPCDPE
ncbi:MAG: hypothetical protein M3Y87_14175 [Myxococcota bacterium]|nr:hypothetical protein [Myxococcota bacterium]